MELSSSGRGKARVGKLTPGMTRRDLLMLSALGLAAGAPGAAVAAGPDNQLTWGVHVSLAPAWFDPADVSGIITPFMVLYALHDATVKLMPGQPSPVPSLAEAWSASEDGLTYDFRLRDGALFHNGDPVTADDVKFSFERYRGASHDLMNGARRRGGNLRPPARAFQAQAAVAGFFDLLCDGHCGQWGRKRKEASSHVPPARHRRRADPAGSGACPARR